MTITTSRIQRIGLAALIAALAACLTLAAPAAAKKKRKKGPGAVDITKAVNLPIPDAIDGPGANNPSGVLTSTIDVPKQFQGTKVRDVNVTVQTLGTAGPNPTDDVSVRLVAPNGAVAFLFGGLSASAASPGVSIGPLTLDDEALLDLDFGAAVDPTRLYSPWAGTAAPDGQLFPMDGGAVRGTWTLQVLDTDPPPTVETSTLVSWRLNVIAGRPFQTK